ncbi:MAG: type II toxin-antitoxin system VapC family toxin [Coriobacteriia bacterium]|nr:type II toxin-antitoxin system VapC family toxin [Coriobacteriia bacterium]
MIGAAQCIVVDASIGVKWFLAEHEHNVEHALRLLELNGAGQIMLHAPSHMRLEIMNALVSRRAPTPEILTAAHDLEAFAVEWHDIDEALSFEAVALASSHSLTVYDAAYLALAHRLDAGLVTADRALAHAAADRLVQIVDFKPDA